MRDQIRESIKNFIENEVTNDNIYNEFSLQHELGIKLREKFKDSDYLVEFERNISHFDITDPDQKIPKREIDIVVYNQTHKYAIELKYPTHEQGQVPEHMYAFLKDIAFCEGLVKERFDAAYAVTLVDSDLYYGNDKLKNDKYPYEYFRNVKNPRKKTINGTFSRPTGKDKENTQITVNGPHNIEWNDANGMTNGKYYIVEISKPVG